MDLNVVNTYMKETQKILLLHQSILVLEKKKGNDVTARSIWKKVRGISHEKSSLKQRFQAKRSFFIDRLQVKLMKT